MRPVEWLKKNRKEIFYFEKVNITLFICAIIVAFVIDITGWSAVIITLITSPVTHAYKFVGFKRTFSSKPKEWKK